VARQILKHHLSPILAAAERWIQACVVEDRPVFLQDSRWTPGLADEVYRGPPKGYLTPSHRADEKNWVAAVFAGEI
jgi:hypothetical protein